MSELGRLLAEARSANGVSLADVETVIRVRQKYLEALEQGNYAALPSGAIARGFVRNYARYLGLEPGEILRLYGHESGDKGMVPPLDSGQGRLIDYRPLEVSLINEQTNSGWWRWVVALLLVGAIAAGAWWFLNNSSSIKLNLPTNWLSALGPQPTRTLTAIATPVRKVTITPPAAPAALAQGPAATATAAGSAAGAQPPVAASPASVPLAPSPTSDLLTLPIPTTRPTVTTTPTALPTATLEPMTGISLTLQITQRSWTKVTADGTMVMQELLEAGQERGWPANERITVLTGNAAGVLVTVNGQVLGAMGNVGQVVERTWSIDQDGNIADSATGPTPTPTKAP